MNVPNSLKSRVGSRTVIFLLLILSVAIPLLHPIGTPLVIRDSTKAFYAAVEAVPAGGIVCIDNGVMVASWPEIGPGLTAVTKRLFEKNVGLVFVTLTRSESVLTTEKGFSAVLPLFPNKKYGVDYVNLGYTAGLETAMAAFAQNVRIFKNDAYGTPIEQLPLLQKVTTVKDFNLFIAYVVSDAEAFIRQIAPFVKLAIVSISAYSPSVSPYLKTGQVVGLLDSIHGCAEYEELTGYTGFAVASMDVMSAAQFLMIALIIAGNIIWYRRRNTSLQESRKVDR
jgi:hypothetical protein